jgi:hypothetical protein
MGVGRLPVRPVDVSMRRLVTNQQQPRAIRLALVDVEADEGQIDGADRGRVEGLEDLLTPVRGARANSVLSS